MGNNAVRGEKLPERMLKITLFRVLLTYTLWVDDDATVPITFPHFCRDKEIDGGTFQPETVRSFLVKMRLNAKWKRVEFILLF